MTYRFLASVCFAALAWGPAVTPLTAQGASVTTYHDGVDRSGHYVVPRLTWNRARHLHADLNFHAELAGHIYAQPLYWHPAGAGPGLLIVATEDNVVYALNARTGATVWKHTLGPPVPRSDLRCGNIDPLGITGTPVIDPESQSVYLDAVVNGGGSLGPQHLIFGLSLRDGSIMSGWPVNVASALRAKGVTFSPRDQNDRGALLILGNTLYVPYGGHLGDCGEYHGWVVSVDLQRPTQVNAWHTRGQAGGIWAPGGIASDGHSLFVTTGNTMATANAFSYPQTWSDGEAIFRLSPDLHRSEQPRDFFAPSNWRELDTQDKDLGGVAPLIFDLPTSKGGAPFVLALGKDGKAYLANRADLGGIGGALATQQVAERPIRTAAAMWRTSDGAYVAFQGVGANCPAKVANPGVVALRITTTTGPPTMRVAWCATLDGAGAPIVTTSQGNVDPIVWITGAEGDNRLHGFRGDTGEPLFTGGGPAEAMQGLRHFGTILAADGRLYVAADGRVYAFSY